MARQETGKELPKVIVWKGNGVTLMENVRKHVRKISKMALLAMEMEALEEIVGLE